MPSNSLGQVIQYLHRAALGRDGGGLTDGQLVERYVSRHEEAAIKALVQRHSPMVWGVCRRVLRSFHDAEDAFQATFLVLVRRAASVVPREMVASWLHGVARQTALKARSAAAKRNSKERQMTEMSAAAQSDSWSDLRPLIDEELSRLSDKYRLPVVLCDLEGKSIKQATQQLGWPQGTLAGRLVRARRMLAKRLTQRGVVLSGEALALVLLENAASAAVPPAVVGGALKAVGALAAGEGFASGAISIQVAALAEGMLQCALVTKVKMLLVVLVGLGLAAAGAGLLGKQPQVALNEQRSTAAIDAPLPKESPENTTRVGQGAQEGNVPPGNEKQPRLDFQGDPLPSGALNRLGSARLRHGHAVKDVAFSPDGKTLASAGQDHAVRLWDAGTGQERRRFTTEEDRDRPFSDSRWAYCIAFSPDGKRLACGDHNDGWSLNTLRIWDVATGKLLHNIQPHKAGVLAVAFAPAGGILASASLDQTVCLLDSGTGQELRRLVGHGGAVRSVAFSADGKMLATAADDHTVRLWTPASGQELRQLVGHEAEVESVCLSPDGQSIVSGSRDRTVRLWDTRTGKQKTVLRHTEGISRVCFAPDGKTLASASMDRTIQFWNVADGKKVGSLEESRKPTQGLSFSPTGKTLASITTDRVCLWDLETAMELHPQPGHQATVRGLGFVQNGGQLISVGLDGMVRWWDWKNGKEQRRVAWQDMPRVFFPLEAELIAFSSDKIALESSQGIVQLLDKTSGREIALLEVGKDAVASLAISPDGKTLASSAKKITQLWDVASRKAYRELPECPGGVKFLRFAPDGRLLLGGNDGSRLWDVAQDKPIRDVPVPFRDLRSAAFSPDNRMLACGDSGGKVELWDLGTGEKARVFTGLAGYVRVAFSRNGRLLAGGGWRRIRVWEVETGHERCSFDGFEGDAFAMAFTTDGRTLASGNGDNNILIWDMSGERLARAARDGDGEQVLQALWKDLALEDGARVHRAIWGLANRPTKAITYLRTMLKPAPAVEIQLIARLTKDLDSESFSERENATKELQKLGEFAEPALKKLLVEPPSLEVKLRAKGLLEKISATSPNSMQKARAIEALGYIGTPEARKLLLDLSHGAPEARVTREAATSLERLGYIQPNNKRWP